MGLPWKTRLAALASRPATSPVTFEAGTRNLGITRSESPNVSFRLV